MAGFVQIIEFKTSRFDELKKLNESFTAERESAATTNADATIAPTMISMTEDRDRPGTYFTIVQFPSYEAAMANSNLPETNEFAGKMAALCDGPPTFYNLNLIDQVRP